MVSAALQDHLLRTAISIHNSQLMGWRDGAIALSQEKDRRRTAGTRIGDAVEFRWNLG